MNASDEEGEMKVVRSKAMENDHLKGSKTTRRRFVSTSLFQERAIKASERKRCVHWVGSERMSSSRESLEQTKGKHCL